MLLVDVGTREGKSCGDTQVVSRDSDRALARWSRAVKSLAQRHQRAPHEGLRSGHRKQCGYWKTFGMGDPSSSRMTPLPTSPDLLKSSRIWRFFPLAQTCSLFRVEIFLDSVPEWTTLQKRAPCIMKSQISALLEESRKAGPHGELLL